MDKMDLYADRYSSMYADFANACDEAEKNGSWDMENGQMRAYYTNTLLSVITCLTAVDGKITGSEAEYIRDIFGFDYTPELLTEIYESCHEGMENILENELQSDLDMLEKISEELDKLFKNMLVMACTVIAESDREIAPPEQKIIDRILALETNDQ